MSARPQSAVSRPSLAFAGQRALAREVAKLIAPRLRQVQDIEVDSSHVGMGWNRQVLQVVQERLLPRTGPWRRYVPAH